MAKSKTAAKKDAPAAKKRGRAKKKDAGKNGDGSAAVVGFEQKLAAKAADPVKAGRISFQNIRRSHDALKLHFGFDAEAVVGAETVAALHRAFQKRHLLAHRMGVVDEDYLRQTADPEARKGRRVTISASEVEATAAGGRAWAEALTAHLGGLP
ncbi:MAG: hypothetical protein Tsb0020_04050 [Haliangiales bacterium]